MSDEQQYIIIDGNDGAKNLIYATWLRSYEASSLAAKHVPRDLFFAEHHLVIDRVFSGQPTVKLAVLPDEPDVVLGWSVSEPGVVHYVYVKPAFRRHGLAKALLAHFEEPFSYTHWTHPLRDLYPRLERCVYNPYLLNRVGA
jgi:GNAT superfamily N-acetyltransferase